MIVTITYVAFRTSYVQTKVTQYIALKLSEKLHAKVSVGKVDISFFDKLILENVIVEDREQREILNVEELWAEIDDVDFEKRDVFLEEISLLNADMLLLLDSVHVLNAQFIFDEFKTKSNDTVSWGFVIDDLNIKNSTFTFQSVNKNDSYPHVMNFSDVEIRNLDFSAKNISIEKGVVHFEMDGFSFEEKSGFKVNNLDAKIFLNDKTINLSNLYLETDNSKVRAYYIDFSFDAFKSFKTFLYDVSIKSGFEDAVLHMNDISYFTHHLKGFSNKFRFSGEIGGTVNDFKARDFRVWFADSTFFKGDVDFSGLPLADETYMYINLKKLYTTVTDLEKIQLAPFYKYNTLKLPEIAGNLGQIHYTGNLTGFFSDFVAYGDLKTNIGNLSTDILIRRDTLRHSVVLKGKMHTKGLNLKKLLKNENVGNIVFDAQVDGVVKDNNDVEANVTGSVSSLDLFNYSYKNISLDALVAKDKFNGICKIDDDNFNLEFFGKLNIADSIPEFDFTASMKAARIGKLHFVSDSLTSVSANVQAKVFGDNPDNFRGKVEIYNLEYMNSMGMFFQPGIEVVVKQDDDEKQATLKSSAVDCEINGTFVFAKLLHNFNDVIHNYLPGYPSIVSDTSEVPPAKLDFSVHIKDVNDIITTFLPDFKIANYSLIDGSYDSQTKYVRIASNIPEIEFGSSSIQNINVYGESKDNKFIVNAKFDMPVFKKIFRNISSDIVFSNDSIIHHTDWNSEDSVKYSGNVNLISLIKESGENYDVKTTVESGEIVIADSVWTYSSGTILVDSAGIYIDKLVIHKDKELVSVKGKVSDRVEDTLYLQVRDMSLENLHRTIESEKMTFEGYLNADIALSSILSDLRVISSTTIEDLKLNNEVIGDLKAESKWNPERKAIEVMAGVNRGILKIVSVYGDIFVETKELALNLELNNLYLKTYESLVDNLFSKVRGYASGNLEILGTYKKPLFYGDLIVKGGGLSVNYLRMPYTITGKCSFKGSRVSFVNIPIMDKELNTARLNGYIDYSMFPDLKYDFFLDLNKLKALNTTRKDNNSFYGSLYADGVVALSGNNYNSTFSVSAKTVGKSVFNIPIYSGADVSRQSIVGFEDPETNVRRRLQNTEEDEESSMNTSILFDVKVTKDALIQIILDETTGDIIKAKGDGDFNIEYTTENDLKIFGEYEIDDGDYLFTLQNLINKKFDIEKGGTILWNGDPYKADVDMKAVYRTKAALYNLMRYVGDENSGEYKKRVPVECIISMKKELLNPEISLSINVPTAQTANDILSSMSTDDISMQFLFLLVFNNFYYEANENIITEENSTNSSSALNVTTMELLSSQLSRWLSQINSDFDIGVNYRPGDEISTDEVELALSTQLLNDRVSVSVNGYTEFGTTDQEGEDATKSTEILGDVNVEVKITKSGNLRVKGFSRSNNDPLEEKNTNTQGVGIFYTKEFDSFSDLFKKKSENEDDLKYRRDTTKTDSVKRDSVIINTSEKDSVK